MVAVWDFWTVGCNSWVQVYRKSGECSYCNSFQLFTVVHSSNSDGFLGSILYLISSKYLYKFFSSATTHSSKTHSSNRRAPVSLIKEEVAVCRQIPCLNIAFLNHKVLKTKCFCTIRVNFTFLFQQYFTDSWMFTAGKNMNALITLGNAIENVGRMFFFTVFPMLFYVKYMCVGSATTFILSLASNRF